jgi:DNA-directed RNA polymerase specialized sigma24 family protein
VTTAAAGADPSPTDQKRSGARSLTAESEEFGRLCENISRIHFRSEWRDWVSDVWFAAKARLQAWDASRGASLVTFLSRYAAADAKRDRFRPLQMKKRLAILVPYIDSQSREPTPLESAELADECDRLRRKVRGLPKARRELIEEMILAEMPARIFCAIHGAKQAAISLRKKTAIRMLREAMN